jgi:hypothetical protein
MQEIHTPHLPMTHSDGHGLLYLLMMLVKITPMTVEEGIFTSIIRRYSRPWSMQSFTEGVCEGGDG